MVEWPGDDGGTLVAWLYAWPFACRKMSQRGFQSPATWPNHLRCMVTRVCSATRAAFSAYSRLVLWKMRKLVVSATFQLPCWPCRTLTVGESSRCTSVLGVLGA